ncbi:unnamed protein product [marine sediment metagenome]|uniref:Uncharacterized protein n=1 Tax=marine sediment metagenome TaxID=412755 RepID=X1ACN5_9ZZZZ
MKPRINLRLCVGGKESLLPQFENCLISYLKFFEIGKLLIYTTSNLQQEVERFVVGLDLPTIHNTFQTLSEVLQFLVPNWDSNCYFYHFNSFSAKIARQGIIV